MTYNMKKNKYLPINWTNGTKLSSEHFIHSYLSQVERSVQMQAFSLTKFNFGLGNQRPLKKLYITSSLEQHRIVPLLSFSIVRE